MVGINITINSAPLCSRCGRNTHIASKCFATKHLNGSFIKKRKTFTNDEIYCAKCGRSGHERSNCYAKTSVKGRKLK